MQTFVYITDHFLKIDYCKGNIGKRRIMYCPITLKFVLIS